MFNTPEFACILAINIAAVIIAGSVLMASDLNQYPKPRWVDWVFTTVAVQVILLLLIAYARLALG